MPDDKFPPPCDGPLMIDPLALKLIQIRLLRPPFPRPLLCPCMVPAAGSAAASPQTVAFQHPHVRKAAVPSRHADPSQCWPATALPSHIQLIKLLTFAFALLKVNPTRQFCRSAPKASQGDLLSVRTGVPEVRF